MKRYILMIITVIASCAILLCACANNSTDGETTGDPTPSVSQNIKVTSEHLVENFDESEYKFAKADVVCKIPEGFEESDYEGEYVSTKKDDYSSISQSIYESDYDLTKDSKEQYKSTIEQEFFDAYGENVEFNITQYDKVMIDHRPGLCIMYNYDFKGLHFDALVYILYNGTESNIITFQQTPGGDWMDEFIASGETIHFTDSIPAKEDEG